MYSLLALGFLIRLWHATGTYLNPDEALHFFVANKVTWWETYQASLNVSHPPLLIFLLRVWRGLGTSELMLRLPSIIAGTVFCWFAYRWLRILFDESAVWIAFTFIVFLPSTIDLSTEVRQYALFLTFAMGSAYFLERALRDGSIGAMLASGVLLWFALFSHFSAFLFAAALGIYAIWRMIKQRANWKLVAVWELGQVVGLAICYWLYVTQISRLGQSYGGTNATKGWMGGDYLGNSYYVPGKINPLLFMLARTGGVFQYVFRQSVVGDLAFALFVVGMVMIFRGRESSYVLRRASSANAASATTDDRRPTMKQLGILLLLPFAFNCAAALMRAYPYGGTRHSAFLIPFGLAAVSIALARFIKGQIAFGIVIALLVSLICNLLPSKRLPYMSAESQRKENMTAAISLLQQLPAGEPIFTDYQTSLSLGHYLCNQQPIEQDRRVAGFISYECSGHKIIATTSEFLFTPRGFYDQWKTMVNAYQLRSGKKVCITQMGWSTYLAYELDNFPGFHISPHYFGNNIQVFELTVGQTMPNPELLPTS
jgi:Dolichyl-phosphate-mannose-protein mannosyltransferase